MVSQVLSLYAAARNTEIEALDFDRDGSLKYAIAFTAVGMSVSPLALGACVACGASLLAF